MNNNKQHIPQGYKSSPLGPIPEDWEVKRLGEVAEVKGGYAFDSKKMSDEVQKYQIVKMGNLYGGILDLSRCRSYWDSLNEIEKDYLLKEGDIVITLTGTVGKKDYGNSVQIKKEKHLLLNQRNAKIVSKTIDINYLFFVVKSERFLHQFYFSSRGGTGSQTNVGIPDIENIRIIVPCLEEQKGISNIVSLWDTAISKQTQLVEKLILRKRGLMQQLLTGKKRLKGFSGEWKDVRLGEILEERFELVGNRSIEPVSVGVLGIRLRSEVFDKELSADYSSNKVLSKHQICFGLGTNQIVFDVLLSDNIYCVSPAYRIYSIKQCNPVFFKALLSVYTTFLSKKHLIISARQGKSVDFNGLLSERLMVPSESEQNAITSVLVNADKEIELANKKLARLQEEKRGLMQVLLSGKKRIK